MMRQHWRGSGEQSKAGHENVKLSSHRCTSQMIILLAIWFVGSHRAVEPANTGAAGMGRSATDIALRAEGITMLQGCQIRASLAASANSTGHLRLSPNVRSRA